MSIEEVFSFKNDWSFNRLKSFSFFPFIVLFFFAVSISLISGKADAATRELVFDPSPDTRVIGYKLYYGESESSDTTNFDINSQESTVIDLQKNTSYGLPELKEGVTYYFAATAYASDGEKVVESVFSDILFYTVPINNNNTYTISASAGAGGSISPSGDVTVSHGADQNFQITPYTGQTIKDVAVNGKSVGAVNTYTFSNVTSSQTISASFETITYTISASAGAGGTISPSGDVTVSHGADQNFQITPYTGQTIKDVAVNGKSVGAVNTYTFSNVTSSQTISASFETITYTISASAGAGGSISPSGDVSVTHGASQEFSITPETGMKIQDVLVNGKSVGKVSNYTFSNVTSSQTILVSFETIVNTEPDSTAHIIEMGEASVNDQWQRVNFTEKFIDPVVVAKPASLNDPAPAVVRIQNVNTTGFDIRVQEWDYLDGKHGYEQISYLAVEKGSYVLPGEIRLEAGTFQADGNNFRFNPFIQTFNYTPVVIASVTSINGPKAVVGRTRNISISGFEYYLQEQEKNKVKHGMETISFIACEPFSGVFNRLTMEVGTTGTLVNQNFHYLSYNKTFSNIPNFLADMQTINDSETANLRWQNKTRYSVEVQISEEKSRDAEVNHSNENVGYIIISNE